MTSVNRRRRSILKSSRNSVGNGVLEDSTNYDLTGLLPSAPPVHGNVSKRRVSFGHKQIKEFRLDVSNSPQPSPQMGNNQHGRGDKTTVVPVDMDATFVMGRHEVSFDLSPVMQTTHTNNSKTILQATDMDISFDKTFAPTGFKRRDENFQVRRSPLVPLNKTTIEAEDMDMDLSYRDGQLDVFEEIIQSPETARSDKTSVVPRNMEMDMTFVKGHADEESLDEGLNPAVGVGPAHSMHLRGNKTTFNLTGMEITMNRTFVQYPASSMELSLRRSPRIASKFNKNKTTVKPVDMDISGENLTPEPPAAPPHPPAVPIIINNMPAAKGWFNNCPGQLTALKGISIPPPSKTVKKPMAVRTELPPSKFVLKTPKRQNHETDAPTPVIVEIPRPCSPTPAARALSHADCQTETENTTFTVSDELKGVDAVMQTTQVLFPATSVDACTQYSPFAEKVSAAPEPSSNPLPAPTATRKATSSDCQCQKENIAYENRYPRPEIHRLDLTVGGIRSVSSPGNLSSYTSIMTSNNYSASCSSYFDMRIEPSVELLEHQEIPDDFDERLADFEDEAEKPDVTIPQVLQKNLSRELVRFLVKNREFSGVSRIRAMDNFMKEIIVMKAEIYTEFKAFASDYFLKDYWIAAEIHRKLVSSLQPSSVLSSLMKFLKLRT